VLKGFKLHPSVASVWIAATRVLASLLHCHDLTHGMLVVLDGLDALAEGIQRHLSDPLATESGLAVLSAFAKSGMHAVRGRAAPRATLDESPLDQLSWRTHPIAIPLSYIAQLRHRVFSIFL
jgi:hypothetical protein